jgi:hypothetical protein
MQIDQPLEFVVRPPQSYVHLPESGEQAVDLADATKNQRRGRAVHVVGPE